MSLALEQIKKLMGPLPSWKAASKVAGLFAFFSAPDQCECATDSAVSTI